MLNHRYSNEYREYSKHMCNIDKSPLKTAMGSSPTSMACRETSRIVTGVNRLADSVWPYLPEVEKELEWPYWKACRQLTCSSWKEVAVGPWNIYTLHQQCPGQQTSDEIGFLLSVDRQGKREITWNQKQLTNLLNRKSGRIHSAEKVADRIGEVQDQTQEAIPSWPTLLKPQVSTNWMKGRTAL